MNPIGGCHSGVRVLTVYSNYPYKGAVDGIAAEWLRAGAPLQFTQTVLNCEMFLVKVAE